jgi:hypothetical protein
MDPERTLGARSFCDHPRAISPSPFGRKVLILTFVQGMFSARSNATT